MTVRQIANSGIDKLAACSAAPHRRRCRQADKKPAVHRITGEQATDKHSQATASATSEDLFKLRADEERYSATGEFRKPRLYADRTVGGDCHHCDPGQPAPADLGQGQQKAHQVVCLGNLKQLSLAEMMYQDDNNQLVPTARIANGAPGTPSTYDQDEPKWTDLAVIAAAGEGNDAWFNALPPYVAKNPLWAYAANPGEYVRGKSVLSCPTASAKPPELNALERVVFNYAMNHKGSDGLPAEVPFKASTSKIHLPLSFTRKSARIRRSFLSTARTRRMNWACPIARRAGCLPVTTRERTWRLAMVTPSISNTSTFAPTWPTKRRIPAARMFSGPTTATSLTKPARFIPGTTEHPEQQSRNRG